MKTTKMLGASVTIVMLLLVPGANAAIGIGAGIAGASIDDALRNDAEIYQGSPGGLQTAGRGSWGEVGAAANCQMSLLFNTIVANLAAAEGLGLAEDNDEFNGRILQEEDPDPVVTWENTTATATCDQAIGPVLVVMDAMDGWGEPAPQDNGIASMSTALFENGGGAMGVGIGLAGADIDDVLENDVEIYQGTSGGGSGTHAASNCQLLVTWNTMILNAGLARGEGDAQDNDTQPDFELPPIGTANVEEKHVAENEMEIATSSCSQSVDSITLVVGDTPTIPPES